ncbi:hypothetical protein CDAR_250211 [Caerostris darwini]|uniref:Uncharacterized protein n=1 Tax=Caerostris darwini TaxID=1538125 RepID=A0AAV4VVL5_9ARAC|nr:hypothetical protein CDAR_250211 [Caerostris darwini]
MDEVNKIKGCMRTPLFLQVIKAELQSPRINFTLHVILHITLGVAPFRKLFHLLVPVFREDEVAGITWSVSGGDTVSDHCSPFAHHFFLNKT